MDIKMFTYKKMVERMTPCNNVEDDFDPPTIQILSIKMGIVGGRELISHRVIFQLGLSV